ncbi:MAG: hypothetical protein CML23_19670 [Rhizobiaceae bacterium]|nr:hypothetical protein [Rhizobiaceae bacterium]
MHPANNRTYPNLQRANEALCQRDDFDIYEFKALVNLRLMSLITADAVHTLSCDDIEQPQLSVSQHSFKAGAFHVVACTLAVFVVANDLPTFLICFTGTNPYLVFNRQIRLHFA